LELFAFGIDHLLLVLGDLVLDSLILDHRLNLVDVLLEVVLSLDLLLSLLVSLFVLFGLLDKSVNLLLRKSSFLVGDGDVRSLTSSFVLSSDSEDTVGIEIK
jgi:hypothetical protein